MLRRASSDLAHVAASSVRRVAPIEAEGEGLQAEPTGGPHIRRVAHQMAAATWWAENGLLKAGYGKRHLHPARRPRQEADGRHEVGALSAERRREAGADEPHVVVLR